jgi:hypothetical protein
MERPVWVTTTTLSLKRDSLLFFCWWWRCCRFAREADGADVLLQLVLSSEAIGDLVPASGDVVHGLLRCDLIGQGTADFDVQDVQILG